MLPHDRASRETRFGLSDASSQVVAGASIADLDPLERERLRQSIQQYGGDRALLELDDEAIDGALGLTGRDSKGNRAPTLTGLLLIAREPALRDLVPTHELAFQVLEREAVGFNEFRRFPLLKLLEWLVTNFRPYNPESESRWASSGSRCPKWTLVLSAKLWPTPLFIGTTTAWVPCTFDSMTKA